MQEVTAYKDNSGRLHPTKREAVVSDFISELQKVWGKMPDQRDRGDPVVIARILAAGIYTEARVGLIEALRHFDDQLAAIGD